MQHHNQEAEKQPTLARAEQTPGIKEPRGVLRDAVWQRDDFHPDLASVWWQLAQAARQ